MREGAKVRWKVQGAIVSPLAFVAALLAPMLSLGCNATRRDPSTCYAHPCDQGRVCTTDHRCVTLDGGGAIDGSTALDSARGSFDVAMVAALDSATVSDVPLGETGTGESPSSITLDAAIDASIDAATGPAFDAEIDVPADAPVALAVDTRIFDAPGTCALDSDCGGQAPFCVDGRCVACKASGECQGGSPICSTAHACVSCAAVDGGCPMTAPACEADSGRCVECATNDDCSLVGKPICDGASTTCVSCTSDAQCAAVGPSVCMSHLDGRCAADAETIYVGSSAPIPCSDVAANAGSASVPYCSAQKGVLAARAKGKPLVVLSGRLAGGFTGISLTSPLTVVGKNAVITPADYSDGIGLTGGEITMRGLTVTGRAAGATGIGINAQATTSATLVVHIDGCTISGNPGGGILLGGAAFDIRNSTVSANGPGQTNGGTSFGGIRVDSLAATGAASLALVSIEDNLAPGLSCADSIQGHGVLASGNAVLDIATSCAVSACTVPSTTCGAQP